MTKNRDFWHIKFDRGAGLEGASMDMNVIGKSGVFASRAEAGLSRGSQPPAAARKLRALHRP
jgi:hypothetical protein